MNHRHHAAVIAALVALGVPHDARGDDGDLTLRWSAPASCPSEDVVRRRVVALAGGEPSAALDAEANVIEADGAFHVTLKVRVGALSGERSLAADSCDPLAESVAVILAMSLTSGGSLGREPVAPPVPPTVPPVPPIVSPRLAAPMASRPIRSSSVESTASWIRIAAVSELDVGTLPVTTYGVGASVALTPGRSWAIGLSASVWAHQDGFVSGVAGHGAHFALLSADATGCYSVVRTRSLDLAPCVLVGIDHIVADGTGTLHDGTATARWIEVGAGARLRWELGRRIALSLQMDAVVPTEPQSFRISGAGQVYSLSAVAFRTKLGPEVRF